MCIRDRPDADGRTLGLTVELPDDFALNQPLAHFALAALEPVSYTHLRAHETVLDIVCRLLLEKKKNQLTSHTSQNTALDTGTSYRQPHV